MGIMPKIVKIKHDQVENKQFSMPDYVFDEGLTLDAIGLYSFLLSRQQVEISLEAINERSSDSPEHNLEILSELEEHRLIKKLNDNNPLVWKLIPVKQV